MSIQRTRIVYAIMSGVLSVILSCGFAVTYVASQNKKLCDVLALSATPRPKPPNDPDSQPSTQYGRDLQEYNKAQQRASDLAIVKVKVLMEDLGCPNADN